MIELYLKDLPSLVIDTTEEQALRYLFTSVPCPADMAYSANCVWDGVLSIHVVWALELLDAAVDNEAITDDGERTCVRLANKVRQALTLDTGRMTFAKFKATRQAHDDLVRANDDWDGMYEGAGTTYCQNSLCIELVKRGPCSSADHYTVQLFGDDYFGTLDDCEAELWAAATAEGIFNDRPRTLRHDAV